jgi:succinyl-CoA synthetase beta subunit
MSMNLHEYQAKQLLADYGIPIPPGLVADSVAAALAHAQNLPAPWIIKAQVQAGGRGKAGGIKFAKDLHEVEVFTQHLLGTRLVTKQSGPTGQPVNCVLLQQALDISRELYLAMLVDRTHKRVAIIASQAGGMDIETVAAEQPERILAKFIDPVLGLQSFQCRQLAEALVLDTPQRQQLGGILAAMHRLFLEKDLNLLEINPLIVTNGGDLVALDAKISIEENALYRQTALAALRDISQEDPREAAARDNDLNYVGLDGSIGCMVNGAGLAMATMDVITLHGGKPANFLDVGGNATKERVTEAFKLLSADPRVKAILVNIFGGIVRCDLIAEGIIAAVRDIGITLPVVARLEGTNVDQGRQLLAQSGFRISPASDLDDAAQQAVTAAEKQ